MDKTQLRKIIREEVTTLMEAPPISMQCNECGKKFKKKLGPKTYEVQCPKCKGYDVEPV